MMNMITAKELTRVVNEVTDLVNNNYLEEAVWAAEKAMLEDMLDSIYSDIHELYVRLVRLNEGDIIYDADSEELVDRFEAVYDWINLLTEDIEDVLY